MTDSAVKYDRGDDGIVVLTLDDPTASANTMNDLYKDSMHAAVDKLYAEKDDVTGVVITSAKKTFFAGGNLKGMLAATPDDAQAVFEMCEGIKADLRRLETFGKPVVAAINGAALGGGLEITLACHHRIVVDDPKVELGLPEATLGLLPGGGGVTRTVRMFGIQSALMDILLQGTRFKPEAAKEKGLVDELVADRDDLVPAAKKWIKAHQDDPQAASNPWDRDGYKIPGGSPSSPSLAAFLPAFPAMLRKQTKGAVYPAPARDHGRGDRGCAGRLRHREPDRVALPRAADRRVEQQEHDPGVLLRPVRDQLRAAASQGRAEVHRHQGRRARRRDDGRRHRVLLRPRRHGGRAQGRRAGLGRQGQGLQREDPEQGRRARQDGREEEGRDPRPDHRHHRGQRLQGLRPRHRGGLRGPVAQGAGLRRDPGRRELRRAAVLEHLDAADHRPRRGREPPRRLHRPALLQPRRQDAAGRDHPRREDQRRRGRQGARRGDADPQDPDRGQRQPRLLHQPRHRHDGDGGPRHARRGRPPDVGGARRDAGRLPGRHAPALRRAEHGADGQDPEGHRRRGRRRATSRTPARPWSRG